MCDLRGRAARPRRPARGGPRHGRGDTDEHAPPERAALDHVHEREHAEGHPDAALEEGSPERRRRLAQLIGLEAVSRGPVGKMPPAISSIRAATVSMRANQTVSTTVTSAATASSSVARRERAGGLMLVAPAGRVE